jgi:hypothetical protein
VNQSEPGQAFAWLGPLRGHARAALMSLFRSVIQTADGRRILADGLEGSRTRPQLPPGAASADVPWYPGLGRPAAADTPGPAPLFITGRFRSGSTLLWNIFRNIPECKAYYEPFNERRWFDPAARGTRTDPTHVGVDDYWREYDGLERLGAFYDATWIDQHLFMDASSWNPAMRAYIQTLVDAARPARAVLQFNRVDFRLAWLRHTFPEARILHLCRHPRDQWCSSLVNSAAFTKDGTMDEFRGHDHFYLVNWARDLRYQFPFLDADAVQHPYQLFYLIWKLSYLFGSAHADYSFAFERLVDTPDAELEQMLGAAGVTRYDASILKRLIVPQSPGKWRAYAPEAWFAQHEAAAEETLRAFFG